MLFVSIPRMLKTLNDWWIFRFIIFHIYVCLFIYLLLFYLFIIFFTLSVIFPVICPQRQLETLELFLYIFIRCKHFFYDFFLYNSLLNIKLSLDRCHCSLSLLISFFIFHVIGLLLILHLLCTLFDYLICELPHLRCRFQLMYVCMYVLPTIMKPA